MNRFSLTYAESISKENGELRNKSFNDLYFPAENAREGVRQVFLYPNRLPDRFNQTDRFVIGELGFGTGLNFFETVSLWDKHRGGDSWLYFLSVDKHPLSGDVIERVIAQWPEFDSYRDIFIRQYPDLVRGLHRINLIQSRVTLDLFFGDVSEMLASSTCPVDCWYLDGFAPAVNNEMWSAQVLDQLASRSSKGATFATFTSAGDVRRGLTDCGFKVERIKGFANKRDSLKGVFAGDSRRERSTDSPRRVIVVGGGLAGCNLAHAFSCRGLEVTLLEQDSKPALRASGNFLAVAQPYLAHPESLLGAFYLRAFNFFLNHLESISLSKFFWYQCGVVQLILNERMNKVFQILQSELPPKTLAKFITEGEVQSLFGSQEQISGAISYPKAGMIKPAKWCEHLLDSESIQTIFNAKVSKLLPNDSGWSVLLEDGQQLDTDVVVLANSYECKGLVPELDLPIVPLRGQIAHVKPNSLSKELQSVICYDGYAIPELDGEHVIGSTYDRNREDIEPDREQSKNLLQTASVRLGNFFSSEQEILSERAEYRAVTPDRLPLVGEHPEKRGIYLCAGFGSRGVVATPLAAQIILSQITAEPLPVEDEFIKLLDPRRYL